MDDEPIAPKRARVRVVFESGSFDGLSGDDLVAAWTSPDWNAQDGFVEATYGTDWCVRAFDYVGSQGWIVHSPDKTLTLFRGSVQENKLGMAWTTDPLRAEVFAWGRINNHYYDSPGEPPTVAYVYKTVVENVPLVVLCEIDANQFSGRRYEREVVVNPALLGQIVTFKTVRQGDAMPIPPAVASYRIPDDSYSSSSSLEVLSPTRGRLKRSMPLRLNRPHSAGVADTIQPPLSRAARSPL